MESYIYGLANRLNFKVNNQIISWERYNININRIALISVGTSTKYTRKPKERGSVAKMLNAFTATVFVLGQIASEEPTEWGDTISAASDLFGDENKLPCLNLTLSNGVTMEITFTDFLTFKEAVIAVKEAYSLSGQAGDIIVDGTDIQISHTRIQGNAAFTELNTSKPHDLQEEM